VAKDFTLKERIQIMATRSEFSIALALIAVYVFFSIIGGAPFNALTGVGSWINPAAGLGLIALPVGLLMIAGELDLSVGSTMAMTSMSIAVTAGHFGWNIWLSILLAIVLGTVVGLINGFLVTKTQLPSFIVTLGTNFATLGTTLGASVVLTGTSNVNLDTTPTFVKNLFAWQYGGQVSISVVWWLVAAIATWFTLSKTKIGNWIYAVGGDRNTARASGVRTDRVMIGLYLGSAMGATLVGIMQCIEFNGAQATNGQGFVFTAIISAVIGGVFLTGGYGSVPGIVMGTLTYSIVSQGFFFSGWDSNWASVVIGVLLLGAVLTNNTFRKLAITRATKFRKK
jgi:simple sugar transport system permease protein